MKLPQTYSMLLTWMDERYASMQQCSLLLFTMAPITFFCMVKLKTMHKIRGDHPHQYQENLDGGPNDAKVNFLHDDVVKTKRMILDFAHKCAWLC